MDLAYPSTSLRSVCEVEAVAVAEYGIAVAALLKNRMADLDAAVSIKDLVAGSPMHCEGDDRDNIVIELGGSHRLFLCANHLNNPKLETGELDWTRVSRVKVLRIEANGG